MPPRITFFIFSTENFRPFCAQRFAVVTISQNKCCVYISSSSPLPFACTKNKSYPKNMRRLRTRRNNVVFSVLVSPLSCHFEMNANMLFLNCFNLLLLLPLTNYRKYQRPRYTTIHFTDRLSILFPKNSTDR